MSDRDPVLHGPYSPQYMMNPTANNFAPTRPQQNGTASQVSSPSSSYLEARVLNLEEGHASLLEDVNGLRELYHGLSFSVDKPKKDEVHGSVDGSADVQKANDIASSKTNGSTPPHLRAASVTSGGTVKSSLPPHLRGKKAEPSNDGR